jgi:Ran GTPase-activating protein (RanGAP) involved in mRNA processing and transport
MHADNVHHLLTVENDPNHKLVFSASPEVLLDWKRAIEGKIGFITYLKAARNKGEPPTALLLEFANKEDATTFSFQNTFLRVEECKCLASSLSFHPNLVELNLDHAQMTDKYFALITRALNANTTLKVLSIRSNAISSQSAKALAIALLSPPNVSDPPPVTFSRALERLLFDDNTIEDDGVVGLSALLTSPSLPKFCELSLNGVKMTDVGGNAIVNALSRRIELSKTCAPESSLNLVFDNIHLARNNIGDSTVTGLCNVLPSLSVQNLVLSSNTIGDNGIAAVSSLVALSKHMKTLQTQGNQFSEKAMAALVKAVMQNRSLQVAHLTDQHSLNTSAIATLRLAMDSGILPA